MNFSIGQKADLLIFDVDGVLIDTSLSYPFVAQDSVHWVWKNILNHSIDSNGFTMDHFYAAKQHPSFNDDYDIAWVFLCITLTKERENLADSAPTLLEWKQLLKTCKGRNVKEWVEKSFGERVSRLMVRRICEEFYYGKEEMQTITGEKCLFVTSSQGYWKRETPMLNYHWKELPLPSAIYTGRPEGEMKLALSLLGWEDFPKDRIITPESGITKPSPKGLEKLCSLFKASYPLYFGDAESDRRSFQAFGKGAFIAIGNTLSDHDLRFETTSQALASLFDSSKQS